MSGDPLELTHRGLVREDGTTFGELEIAGCMDNVARVLVVLALLAYSVFRLIRYFRYGMARRVTAVPPSTWGVLPATETPAVAPATRSARILASGTSILVFATANAILC